MKLSTKFIKRNNEMCDFDKPVCAPYFRKTFDLDFQPEKAEITVTGLGFYELYINGKNITKGPLAPYISNFHQAVFYDNYDLTDVLKKGKNAVALVLGNGMRNCFGGFIWDFDKIDARGPVCAALCIEAKDDNNSFILEADDTFKTHDSPILFDDLRMGYVYDSRNEIENWAEADFDDSGWDNAIPETTPAGRKILCDADPIAYTGVLKPVSVRHFDRLPFAYKSTRADSEPFEESFRDNVYLYDFGENNSGVSVLKINGKPGQKITVRHAEYAPDGLFSITNISFVRPGIINKYIEYAQKDVFICKGGYEEFVPKFKYDGFRYLFVEGLEEDQATEDAFEFWTMSSNLEKRASFASSDEMLNKLAEMTCRSDISNFLYFPTDCPQREKNGWTGDASMSAEHQLLWLKAEKSLAQWLETTRYAQLPDGNIPSVIPTYGWSLTECVGGPAWDSFMFKVTKEIYRHTGDKKIINDNAQMMLRYLSYILTKIREDGTICYGLPDWLDPNMPTLGRTASPGYVTDTLLTLMNAQDAAFLFDEAGLTFERDFAKNIADLFRKNFREHLIYPDTCLVNGNCQTSQALAIAAGVFNEDEIETARKNLIEIVHRDSDENACGMQGIRYIFHVLCDIGEYDLAYKMITSTNRTGYGSWVKKGLTTLAEKFYYDEDPDFGSLNHHFLGDILSIFIQEFAGVKPNPNYDDTSYFEISPCFIKGLEFCQASYETENGLLSSRYDRIDEKKIKLSINVPDNMKGVLKLRKSNYDGKTEIEITSGKYEFIVEEN